MITNAVDIESAVAGPESGAAAQLTESVSQSIGAIVKQIEALDAEKAMLVDQLRTAQERIAAEFGKYSELLTHEPAVSGAVTRGRGRMDPNKVCAVCGERGHDARRHKSGTNKKGNA